mgnify:FL=1
MNCIISLFLLLSFSFSQIQHGGSPKYSLNLDNPINFISTEDLEIINRNLHPMVKKYADEYQVNVNVLEAATKIIDLYETTFYLGVESPGAKAIAFVFDKFYLTDNSKMFISSEDEFMSIGSFNSNNNNPIEEISTAVVKGDRVIIELTVPNNEIKDIKLNLGVITHDFLDLMNFHNENAYNDRVDCNDNVVCPYTSQNGWDDQVDAVVLVASNGGTCSAALVNNTEFDKTPYILYAAHCYGGSSTVYFNYQANTCTGNNPGNYNTMSGTQQLAIGNFNNNDYALIRLYNNIPDSYNPYYAGWNRSSSNPGNNIVGIHHADGDIKKISYDAYGMSSSGNAWDFGYSSGRVIPGSSGSPMFDSNKRIRGMASYIYTNYCNPAPDCYCAQNYYHGYAKFSSAWTYIDQYLDPNNSGVTFIDGTRDGITDILGCTDPEADNYNPDANIDDGSCEYSYGNASFAFGTITGDNIQVIMSNDVAVGGFQFTLTDNPDVITITGANGGSAAENGFEVSTSDLGIVLGFSFTGDTIPAGSSVLTNLSYSLNGGGITTVCVDDAIVSDSNANPLSVGNNSCEEIDYNAGSAAFTFGELTQNSIEVFINNSIDIAGFQFSLTDNPDLVTLVSASGGLAAENGFEVSTSELGIVIGFSLTGSTIPSGTGLLTTLEFTSQDSGNTDICITETIASDSSGQALLSSGECTVLEILDVVLGDINTDSVINIQDVVILINFILQSDSPEGNEQYAADLNSDGILNVQDVVILIGVILG